MILFDTHVLLWFTMGDRKLGTGARQIIEESFETGILVSVMTFWEISLLVNRRRLDLGQATADWVSSFCARDGIVVTRIDSEVAVAAGELPGGIHGDPADRMLIATARTQACPLLTGDRAILAYAANGHVSAIDARL